MRYLAEIDIPAVIGVLTGFCMLVVLPIVYLLLNHQRKMAEIVRGGQEARSAEAERRLERMEAEIAQLRHQLAENILAFDDRRQASAAPPPIPERLKGN